MNSKGQGRVVFAAVALALTGVMRMVDAVWAFTYHGIRPGGLDRAVTELGLSSLGWIYMVGAAVFIVCAAGVIAHSRLSRWIGVVAASACIADIWPMPQFPFWPLTYIVLGGFVVYVLVTCGGEPASS